MPLQVRHPINGEAQSSDNGTFRYDLPEDGALYAIMLKVLATNGATAGRDVDITDVVDEIRVMADGTRQLFVLHPLEFEKWHETLQGQELQAIRNEAAAAVQEMVFPIIFGRHFLDPDMYLPLDAFNNVQLQVDFSPNIAADGGFATGTTSFDVVLYMDSRQRPGNYLGTLLNREIRNFTSAASGDQADEIDTDRLIRAIGVYAYEEGIADGVDITRVRLRMNAGEQDLLDLDWDEFLEYNRELFGSRVEHNFHLFIQDTDTIAVHINDILGYSVELREDVDIAADTFEIYRVDTIAGDLLTFNASLVDVTAAGEDLTAHATDEDVFLSVWGRSPSSFGLIPFIGRDIPEDYLNPREWSKIETVLTQGAAGADVRLALQELERF